MKIEKPLILLSTARSGSTPMYQILELYLRTNYGIQGVEEILNPYYGEYFEQNGKIAWHSGQNKLVPGQYEEIFIERFELLKKYQGKVFLKVFPTSFRDDAFYWLRDNHQFVTNERENLWEQTLSYLVSDTSHHWYSETGLRALPGSLEPNLLSFRAIEKSIFHFYQLKKVLNPIASFSYEEMLKFQPDELLQMKGFTEKFPKEELVQVKKQTHSPKLTLLKNAEEVKAWYRDSFMEQLCPLDKSLV